MEKSLTVIAEMAWAHDGSFEKAKKILKGAKIAGADALGIQVTNMPTFMVPHYGSGKGKVSSGKEHLEIYKYLDDIDLSNKNWIELNSFAKELDIGLCIVPNDFASLEFCEKELSPMYYAVSAGSFVEPGFIEAIARTNRPTFFRIGGATLGETEDALRRFRNNGTATVTLLHGFQNYPTKLEDIDIRQLSTIRNTFNVPVGLADHIDGGHRFAKILPILALTEHASVIEKHITWDRSEKGEDFEAALDPQSFKEFVENLKAAEIALGSGHWKQLSTSSQSYRTIIRKKAIALKNMNAGDVLRREDIWFKRSDVGLEGDKIERVIGRVLTKDLSENEGITMELFL